MKVLIAEDDPIFRRKLEKMLVQWGYDVTVTCDGVNAWQVFQGGKSLSLVILDWIMPGMDGTEVCRKIREMSDYNPPYIILLAAKDYLECVVDESETGPDDYVT
jgi:DNA-binding response OmpR family regulator